MCTKMIKFTKQKSKNVSMKMFFKRVFIKK